MSMGMRCHQRKFVQNFTLSTTSVIAMHGLAHRAFHRFLPFMVALAALAALPARAQLTVEITGAGGRLIPVAIPYLAGEESLPAPISQIVSQDLAKSGIFQLVDVGMMRLPEDQIPDYANLAQRGADAVLAGTATPVGAGQYEVRVRVFDTRRQADLGGILYRFTPSQTRATAHRIADFVYEKLTGVPGYFASRLAYVVKQGSRYELRISEADGSNSVPALISQEPIISPAWSPDGTKVAYFSFEAKKPVVYVHELASGQRRAVANFKGSNSAPAFSPDGQNLAVALTRDGISQIYLVPVSGGAPVRLSRSSAIDTEPVFSPDGRYLYFTSDRGGSPQIYRMPASGGAAERVTFEGEYNVSPDVSSDGKLLTFVTRNQGRYQVALLDLQTRQQLILSDSSRDESPSFAPNGRMIVYASESGGRGSLFAVSTDGKVRLRLSAEGADVREPAWGPLPR